MGLLNTLLGKGPDLAALIEQGAMIIDVRTRGEYQGGHVAGSKNIPLDEIDRHIDEIKHKNKPVILCCASGMRSGSATNQLKKAGVDAHNGGSWMKVNNFA